MTPDLIIGIVFGLYIVAMLWIGVAGFRRTKTLLDYLLAGRRLGPGVAALSAGASDMSGWLLMGLPGAVLAAGMSEAWIGVGLLAGSYLRYNPAVTGVDFHLRGNLVGKYFGAVLDHRRRRLIAGGLNAQDFHTHKL